MSYYLRSITNRNSYSKSNYLKNDIRCLNSRTSNDKNLSLFYVEDLKNQNEIDNIVLNLIFANEKWRDTLYFLPIEAEFLSSDFFELSKPSKHPLFNCTHYNLVNVDLESDLKLIEYCNNKIKDNLIIYNQADMAKLIASIGKEELANLTSQYFQDKTDSHKKVEEFLIYINNKLFRNAAFLSIDDVAF